MSGLQPWHCCPLNIRSVVQNLQNLGGVLTSRQIATPLAQKGSGNSVFSGEDGHWDSTVAGGQVLGPPGDDIVAVQALVTDALIPQKLGQPAGCRDGAALAACAS